LKLAWGEARRSECIPCDTRPTEQRSPRPISAQPEGRHVFWAEALLLAPHRSTSGYALVPVRKHLAPGLRPKSIAANVSLFRRHHTSGESKILAMGLHDPNPIPDRLQIHPLTSPSSGTGEQRSKACSPLGRVRGVRSEESGTTHSARHVSYLHGEH